MYLDVDAFMYVLDKIVLIQLFNYTTMSSFASGVFGSFEQIFLELLTKKLTNLQSISKNANLPFQPTFQTFPTKLKLLGIVHLLRSTLRRAKSLLRC